MTDNSFHSVNHEDAIKLVRAAIDRVTDPSACAPGDALYALSEILEAVRDRARDYQEHLTDVDGSAAGDRIVAHLAIAQMTFEVAAN